MLCPLHQVPLLKSEKHGIEIDYCPTCQGAWFERGELDKVIEVYAELRRQAQGVQHAEADYLPDYPPARGRSSRRREKIKDFLEDLFDFD